MFKLTPAVLVALVCLAGCGGQSADSSPPKQPTKESDVEVEFKAPDETTEPASPEPETAKPESDKPESPPAETNAKTAPAKKSCKGLPKKDCEITDGCAWSTTKSCITQ